MEVMSWLESCGDKILVDSGCKDVPCRCNTRGLCLGVIWGYLGLKGLSGVEGVSIIVGNNLRRLVVL